MKKIIAIGGIIILVGVLGYFIFGKKDLVKNVPLKNEKIIIFGDSLAEGIGATSGNDIATLMEKRFKKAVLNYGKSGDTTRDALDRLPLALEEDPGIALIILGGNDVLKKVPKEETFQNLEKIINLFQDQGAAVVLVGVRSGLIGDGRGDDYVSLADKTQSAYMPDILNDVFGKRQYMSDAIHPNDAGYRLIERRMSPIIDELFSDK